MEINILILHMKEFTGSVDTLFENVRAKKIDIMQVDLIKLTNQYLQHVRERLTSSNVERISDYLVTISYLVELKSKHVLVDVEEEDEEIEKDEENSLVRYLLEYKQYKSVLPVAEALSKKSEMVFAKPEDDASLFEENEIPVELPDHLSQKQIMSLLQRIRSYALANENIIQKILVEEIPVEEVENRLIELIKLLSKDGQYHTFAELMKLNKKDKLTQMFFVTSFLALLNLGHHQKIRLRQDQFDDEILVQEIKDEERTSPIVTDEELLKQQKQFEKDVQEYSQKIKKERYEKYLQKKKLKKMNNKMTD